MAGIDEAALVLRTALAERSLRHVPLANVIVWGVRPPEGREFLSLHVHLDEDAALLLAKLVADGLFGSA